MSILEEICDTKRDYIKQRQQEIPLDLLKEQIIQAEAPRGFIKALNQVKQNDELGFICEIKKASPSQGVIRNDFSPKQHAKQYEENGATCLSILTDMPYFQGHDDYLKQVKQVTPLPTLRKDFIIDPYQVYESRALGADCILLIIACLEKALYQDLYALAIDLKLDVLVEIHDEKELETALSTTPKLVGVNNRNLKTMAVDLATGEKLLSLIPQDVIKICESGIKTKNDIVRMSKADADGFLIGQTLMEHNDPGLALSQLKPCQDF